MRLIALTVSVALLVSSSTAQAVDDPGLADPYVEYKNRGAELFAAGKYDEAMKAFLGAYAIRKERELLFELGRTSRELGRSRGALDYLQRFLVDEPSPPTPRGLEAARVVRELVAEQARAAAGGGDIAPVPGRAGGHAAGTSSVASLPEGLRLMPVKVEKQRNTTLMAAGGMMLGFSYMAAFTSGVWTMLVEGHSRSDISSGSLYNGGAVLVVPVVGGLFTGLAYREASWAAPWALLDGMAQVSGLVMIILGAGDKHDVLVPAVAGTRVSVLPWANGTGGGLTAGGVF